MLKPEAFPTIFDVDQSTSHQIDSSDFESTASTVNSGDNCILKAKISELEIQIRNMTMQHTEKVQKLTHSLDVLRTRYEEQGEKLNHARKELEQKKAQTSQFKEIIQDLRNEKYISEDDKKFLDVCS